MRFLSVSRGAAGDATWRPRWAVVLSVVAAAACSSVGGPASPSPEPEPASQAEAPERVERPSATPSAEAMPSSSLGAEPDAPPPPPPAPRDPVLEGSWSERSEFLDRQAWYEDLWRGRGSSSFERYLERMGAYRHLVEAELEARDMPGSLRYLPIVESGYNPRAVSRAGAVGLWQLMSGTARDAGLTVNAVVDERRDPWRSTKIALTFLDELYDRFQSWPLALSAYNGGPARVARLARRHAQGQEYGDSVYYVIRPYLPRETRDFVPKLMAASALAAEPDRHGFGHVEPLPPLTYDEVTVPDATSVDVLAQAAGVDQEDVERLNPQLRRGFTPAGRETTVRVPRGTHQRFAEAYARIPPDERVTFLEHRVARGDTFWDIARAYGVNVDLLQDANPGVRPDRLQIGQWITVPRAPAPGGPSAAATRVAAAGGGGGGADVHVVRRGDTLWAIARRYGVDMGALLRWNGLDEDAVIRPGDRLKVGQ